MKDIISKRRKELGLTQQELADKLFVSDKVISKWETGKSVPDTSILVELSKALEISLDELLQSNEPINKNTQLAVADTLSIKFKNVMLVSYSLAIISSIFFVISRLIDYNDYKRENKVFVWLFLGLALALLTACITYYLINRNKLLIDYPKFHEIDKKNFNQFMNVMGILTIIVSVVNVFTFETMHKLEHVFEALFVLVIVLVIELVIWLFIKHLYSKKEPLEPSKEPFVYLNIIYNVVGGGNMLFQDTLKELRKKKGISQYDLADALNISRSVIAKWETGLTLPSEDNINILCEYFDVTQEELMGNFEVQEIITDKIKKISLFKKIIFILSSLLLITIITIIVLASIGFRGGNHKEPPITSDTTYTLRTNDNNIYPFKPKKIKPSDGVEQEKEGYVLTDISLNREQSVTLFKDDEIFNDVEIRWTCNNSDKGTNDSLGSYNLWQEGLYNFTLFENYYEEKLIYIEIKLEKVDTIYQAMNIYFVDNNKTSISMKQITPETDTNFSSLMWCWYAKDCMLEEGDKIFFSTRLSVTNELYVLNGFNESSMFEEIYDDEFNGYYLLIKETHVFSTILLEYDGSKINLYYEYDSE